METTSSYDGYDNVFYGAACIHIFLYKNNQVLASTCAFQVQRSVGNKLDTLLNNNAFKSASSAGYTYVASSHVIEAIITRYIRGS